MLRAAMSCPEIKYLGLEVTYITSAMNSLVKASQMVTLKHNEIKKANFHVSRWQRTKNTW